MKEDTYYEWIEQKYEFKPTVTIRNALTEYFVSEYGFYSVKQFHNFNQHMLNNK